MTTGIQGHLQGFRFQELFIEELGLDNFIGRPLSLSADDDDFALEPVAHKRGFVVYRCGPDPGGKIPPRSIRRRIEGEVTKLHQEHLIIFVDAAEKRQTWQWAKRVPGKSAAYREYDFHAGQSGRSLAQRLSNFEFTMQEEAAGIGIVDVTRKAGAAFDVEKVTKRFYDRFSKEREAFSEFIEGITSKGDRDWYASLMLNRMMFVYFIQKQGFLDSDRDYLRNKLAAVRSAYGTGQFQGFYRQFLLRLFHEGLGKPESERAPDLAALLGDVPFLNGGLFDPHELERTHEDIDIPDETFERVFTFFDSYRWHLDERPGEDDNEINPDVLGYIFEKYVNQKQMGAYYTKEDITGYISRNTVIPFLFDAARRKDTVAFQPDGGVWRLLQDDPDRYIYPAVGHGIEWNARDPRNPQRLEQPVDLPPEIAAGISDVSKRGGWNAAAPEDYALPTETWREVVARRQRYDEVRAKIASGEVQEINDLITLNLNIERFARDVIAQSEGPDLIRAFWQALRQVSVLDPTCGSGAFLFAALNVLEPLYTVCLEGMRRFLDSPESSDDRPRRYVDFRQILDDVDRHPNERYYILKSIVLNNLYGVDIMEEATEICKLRLFLKLVAQVENVEDVEPLPDIDFNIKAGNTLVGFTSLDAVTEAMTVMPDGQHRQVFPEDQRILDAIVEAAKVTDREYNEFREQQTPYGSEVTPGRKAGLREGLLTLTSRLDGYLAKEYGVDTEDEAAYGAWRGSHQPFHWFAEFYGIMANGGFDVVIGNPPYVARSTVGKTYRTRGFITANCPDIYASIVERSVDLSGKLGRTSMIVPLSLTFSSKFDSLRSHLYSNCGTLWFASFGRIPSALFSFDTRVRNTIFMGYKPTDSTPHTYTTRLHRWFDSERPTLFDSLSYARFSPNAFDRLIPKLGSERLIEALERLLAQNEYRLKNEFATSRSGAHMRFKQTAYNWLTFCRTMPPVYDSVGRELSQTKYGTVAFSEAQSRDVTLMLASGKLLFLWWAAIGDDFDLTQTNFASAPIGPKQLNRGQHRRLLAMLPRLEEAMESNVEFKLNAGKNIGNYNLARCRHITDESDKIWLDAVGLSHLWGEIELEHARVVRTSFEGE